MFYGALFAVAMIWRIGSGHSIFYISEAAAAEGVAPFLDPLAGIVVALAMIALSRQITDRTRWGELMGRALAALIGKRSIRDCIILAIASGVAEEAFFRGVLQPRLGLVVASLIFGVAHFAPKRALLPWTGFAVGAGFVLGGLFALTGNLVAPIVAHIGINAVNLRRLGERYAGSTR